MEPLWSPVVATGGNQWQMAGGQNPRKQAKTVANGCHRSPETFHGKEGVSGSSPEEAPQKPRKAGFFFLVRLHNLQRAVGMELSMEP
jgi:hypothetical protein